MTNAQRYFDRLESLPLEEVGPTLRQYYKLKSDNVDKILLFRVGEFYETYFEDAAIVSRILNIVLTSKKVSESARIPLAGIPQKSCGLYILRLIQNKCKIALCEENKDVRTKEGILEREVVKLYTPGTIIEDEFLTPKSNNYLCAVYKKTKNEFGLAYCDISTGEFRITKGALNDIINEIARINPSELISCIDKKPVCKKSEDQKNADLFWDILQKYSHTILDPLFFEKERAFGAIKKLLKISTLDAYGGLNYEESLIAAGAIVQYLLINLQGLMPEISRIENYSIDDYMLIDETTRFNLEINVNAKERTDEKTLLSTIDRTASSGGGRLIKNWINQPLKDLMLIKQRHDAVQEIIDKQQFSQIRKLIGQTADIVRICIKITNSSATIQDFANLRQTLNILPALNELTQKFDSELINCLEDIEKDFREYLCLLNHTLEEEPPSSSNECGAIKQGVNGELDYLFTLIQNAKNFEEKYLNDLKKITGIKNLKICSSRSFGSYIEVNKKLHNKLPKDFILKQSLTNHNRYITKELKEHQKLLSSSVSKSLELEKAIFSNLKSGSYALVPKLRELGSLFSQIDVLNSFAQVALENDYVRPVLNDSLKLKIIEGRHPVLEHYVKDFVSNSIDIEGMGENSFMMLTGANMSGKSTYMRQNAIIVLLAQTGSFISAKNAQIGLVDRIFVKANTIDNISSGYSTFMMEMVESGFILNSATPKSFVLLDEPGVGTSSGEGLALAKSMSIYLGSKVRCRSIFATHFQELSQLEEQIRGVKNYKIETGKENGTLSFGRKITRGVSLKSHGVEIAKLAGLPEEIIRHAEEFLSSN